MIKHFEVDIWPDPVHPITETELIDMFNDMPSKKISAIKLLRTFRTQFGGDNGLRGCKDAVEACHTSSQFLALFGNDEGDEKNERVQFDTITARLPVIFEHYKDFGFANFLGALQFIIDTMK